MAHACGCPRPVWASFYILLYLCFLRQVLSWNLTPVSVSRLADQLEEVCLSLLSLYLKAEITGMSPPCLAFYTSPEYPNSGPNAGLAGTLLGHLPIPAFQVIVKYPRL